MNRRAPMTPAADVLRALPTTPGARLDDAHAALASLRAEESRLERLGLEDALRRCREQKRYWEFLAALFSLTPVSPVVSALRGAGDR